MKDGSVDLCDIALMNDHRR
ncbi:DUF6889 family protein [Enterobacter asburiae]